MNKIYRMIWSKAKEQWVVVSEKVSAKGAIPSVTVGALTVAALLAAGGGAFALDPGALPTGGRITAGNATIATSGNQMTINQSSQQMIANWNSFNIGQNAGVSFNQPNSGATALNRIQDQNPTQILGSLSANGRIFLLNPAGIIFGQNAKVDVGGLVASSLNMLDSDFLAGRYTFSGPGNAGSIINQGNLSANGGIVALIAPKVSNEGTITATNGSAALIAGNQVSVDFQGDGLITYTVDQGAVDALAENKGLIKADGGLVVLTAKAANALTNAVVNNSGVIEAQTLVNKGGRILLLSDMQSGATSVSGTLDASAPDGGDGGFVETSGGRVKIGSGTVITTRAPSGTSGTWLIDPDGYTIAASGGDIDGTTLGNNVDNNGDTIISSTDGSGSDGNINVNDNVTWHANNLALIATNDININAVMTAGAVDDTGDPGTFASLDLEPGSGTVNVGFNPDGTFKGKVDFFQADGVTPRSGAGFLTINGNPYTVITDLGLAGDESTGDSTLQGMAYGGNSSGYFALGSNIDATDTSGWNYGEGFVPIGTGGYSFTGTFDGLGHTISNLSINRNANEQGLFGVTDGATLRNVGLTDVNVTGYGNVGALVGYGYGTAIMNSSVIGSVTAGDYSTGVGGLMGYDYGGSSIINSHASATVTAGVNSTGVGGLMGYGYGSSSGSTILNSHATGNVTGGNSVGGLVGYGYDDSITNSYATGEVTGTGDNVGGLVGYTNGSNPIIDNSYATGPVTGNNYVGGLVGSINSSNITISNNSHADGLVTGNSYVGGLVGSVNSGGTINISDAYAIGGVKADINPNGQYIGGLVGYLYGGGYGYGSGSEITNSHASGIVTAGDSSSNVGGLIGYNENVAITDSDASGAVTAGAYGDSVGGLVGNNSNGAITSSHATGKVTVGAYSSNVGGLVGNNADSAIDGSYATGEVAADAATGQYVGGLVGYNNSNSGIDNSYATGPVTGNSYVGGLVGYDSGNTITNSYATGAVHAGDDSSNVGGLVGYGYEVSITNSHADGPVTAGANGNNIGGLVGDFESWGYGSSSISDAYATGAVTGGADSSNIGGLVGNSYSYGYGNTITNSFATGAVTADATASQNVGGLVGTNNSNSSIDNSYATGPVTGNSYVGGLVGYDNGNGITNSFATGPVTGGSYAGGLVGDSGSSVITSSFWDKTVNSDPALDNGFGTGKTTTELKTLATFTDAGWDIDDAGGTGSVWRIYDGNTMPLLRGFLTPLTSIASPVTKAYDGTAYTGDLDATYSDPTAPASGHLQGLTSPYASFVNAGTYSPSPAYSDQLGYDITASGDSSLTVTPAALSITASDASKSYGQTPTLSAFTSSGLQNSETIGSVTLASAGTAATAGVSGSPYAITASNATGGSFSAANYTITYNNGALTITPAALSITAGDASKSYGQTPTLSAFTSSGLQNGETIGSVTLASAGTAATAGVSGSPYTIAASNATGGTFSAGNYTITYNNGALTVTPAALSITASDASKSYGQTPTLSAFTSSGLQNGETIGSVTLASAGTAATAAVSGSPYAITASNATGGTFSAGNYTITYNNGALTVTPAALSITAGDASKSYGQTPTLSAFTSSGLQNGETIGSVTLASAGTAATAAVSGSPYAITASNATGGSFNAANYTITYNNGALTITPAALSITAGDATKSYGQTTTFTGTEFTSSGLQNSETIGSVTLASTGAAASASAAGSPYAITASNATGGTFNADNYTIGYNDGVLTVSAVPTVADEPVVADEPIQQPVPTPLAVSDQRSPPSIPQPPAPIVDYAGPGGGTPVTGASITTTGGSGTPAGVGGLSVTLVSQPTSQNSGIIAVAVPDSMAQPGSAFSFQLPEQARDMAAATAAAVTVSLSDGGQLPGWLRYSPESNTFTASDVPAGSLPIKITVTVGDQSWTVEITKQQA